MILPGTATTIPTANSKIKRRTHLLDEVSGDYGTEVAENATFEERRRMEESIGKQKRFSLSSIYWLRCPKKAAILRQRRRITF